MSVECKAVGTEFMAKRLLIMALVAVQCASWSGASLFLCLGADGSVCIDGGPESCTSCHEEDAGHACCDCHSACQHDDHDDSCVPHGLQLASDPCDCTHVQIAQSQAPSVVAKSVAQSGLDRTAAFVMPTTVDRHTFSAACHDLVWRTRRGPSLAPSLLLATVGAAVINC